MNLKIITGAILIFGVLLSAIIFPVTGGGLNSQLFFLLPGIVLYISGLNDISMVRNWMAFIGIIFILWGCFAFFYLVISHRVSLTGLLFSGLLPIGSFIFLRKLKVGI